MKHEKSVLGAVISKDGQRILSWSDDGTARLWEAASGLPVGQPMKLEKSVLGAVLSGDGQRILSWSDDGTARLWSAANNALIAVFPHAGSVTTATFDPRERRVLTASGDGTVKLWDISLDPGIPVKEHTLEFEVRSATTLAGDGSVRILSETEWSEKLRLWQDTLKKRNAKP